MPKGIYQHPPQCGFQKGHLIYWEKPPMLGKYHSEITKKKMSKSRLLKHLSDGSNNPNWKGDKAGYFALHHWIYSQKGKPEVCEHCGITAKERRLHWANKDHKYSRNPDDYLSLCPTCHKKYDRERPNLL